jgi:hypothetical protein
MSINLNFYGYANYSNTKIQYHITISDVNKMKCAVLRFELGTVTSFPREELMKL